MPDAFEFPRMLRAVVPEMLADFAFVHKLIALARGKRAGHRQFLAAGNAPRLAAVVGALHDLPEPAARLRRVNPVGVNG